MVGTGRMLDASDVSLSQQQSFYTIVDGVNASFNTTPFYPKTVPAYPITRSQLAYNTDRTDEVSFDPATQIGWYEDLGFDLGTPAVPASGGFPGTPAVPSTGYAYRIIDNYSTALGIVAFSSFLPGGDICAPSGSSRAYARSFATAQSVLSDRADYVQFSTRITDLQLVSAEGKLRLIGGNDKGETPQDYPNR